MTILFTFAVAYTWLAYLRDWDAYRLDRMKKYAGELGSLMDNVIESIHTGQVPTVSIISDTASDESVADLVESIHKFARLLGGTVNIKIER